MARSSVSMQYSIAVEIRRGHESVWRTRMFDRAHGSTSTGCENVAALAEIAATSWIQTTPMFFLCSLETGFKVREPPSLEIEAS
jgi:hypothetical protein